MCCLGTSRDAVWRNLLTDSSSHDAWTHIFSQSVRFWIVTCCGLRKQHVETLHCSVQYCLHQSDLMKLSMPHFTSVYYHGWDSIPCKCTADKEFSVFALLQPWDCRMIHFDNSREETAGTTVNARLRCCTLFTSLHMIGLEMRRVSLTYFYVLCYPEENLVSHHVTFMWLKHSGVIAAPLRVQCFQETIWRPSHLDTPGHASQACSRCCQNTQLWVMSHSSEHWVSLFKSTNGWKTRTASNRDVKYNVSVSKINLFHFRALWQTASVWAVSVASLLF